MAGTRGGNAPGIPRKCLRCNFRHGNVISATMAAPRAPRRRGVGNRSEVLEAKSITPRLKLPEVKLGIIQALSSAQFTLQEVTGKKFRDILPLWNETVPQGTEREQQLVVAARPARVLGAAPNFQNVFHEFPSWCRCRRVRWFPP